MTLRASTVISFLVIVCIPYGLLIWSVLRTSEIDQIIQQERKKSNVNKLYR